MINRGNARAVVFQAQTDYQEFVDLLRPACDRIRVRVLGYCLMPNHFHLVLWPRAGGDLGRWMQWLMTSHVRRHHRRHGGSGHIWQGRFKAFPIQNDGHLLTVLRYVERNALRAGLAGRAEDWPWSSLRWWGKSPPPFLHPWPVERPGDWLDWVNQPQAYEELQALRRCVNRGTPFGDDGWVGRVVRRLGLEFTVRPPGRPRKEGKK